MLPGSIQLYNRQYIGRVPTRVAGYPWILECPSHLSGLNAQARLSAAQEQTKQKTLKLKVLTKQLINVDLLKNPAYGRHQLSRPMLIVGPIQI